MEQKRVIGVTGCDESMGRHLRAFLFPLADKIGVVEVNNLFFNEKKNELKDLIKGCDVVVHLAGVFKGEDEDLYNANVDLASQLIGACDSVGARPHIIFSSTTQIYKDSAYGRSKKQVGEMLRDWANESGAIVTNLIIPNEFGEFNKPFYNSFIDTFCHQLVNNEEVGVNEEASVSLVHSQKIVKQIYDLIKNPKNEDIKLEGEEIRVAEVYRLLSRFKEDYLNNIIPLLENDLQVALFNTLRHYFLRADFYPRKLDLKTDERGSLFEVSKERTGGQVFMSTTKPGVTRGNHYHTRKIERFCVVKGEAEIKIRDILLDERKTYHMNGNEPSYVDMPTFYTHNITNVGKEDLITLFWVNEIYNPDDADTFYIEV